VLQSTIAAMARHPSHFLEQTGTVGMAEFRLGTESTRARNAHSKELHATPGEVCDWVPICASFASIDGGGALAATRPNTIAQGIALGLKGSALGFAHSKELHATPGEVWDWVPICASFASIDGGGALAATRPNTIAQGNALGSKGIALGFAHFKELHATPGEVWDWVPICASFASIDGGGALAATRPNTIAQGSALGSKGSALGSKGSALGSKGIALWGKSRRITPSVR
jgi:hypothetical protein